MKKWPRCGEDKSLSEFYYYKTQDQHASYCKRCYREYQNRRNDRPGRRAELAARSSAWAKANRAKINAARKRKRREDPEHRERENARDRARHDCCSGKKSCGQCVRGLLCNRCNPMLGYADDDPSLMWRAIEYLEKWQRK